MVFPVNLTVLLFKCQKGTGRVRRSGWSRSPLPRTHSPAGAPAGLAGLTVYCASGLFQQKICENFGLVGVSRTIREHEATGSAACCSPPAGIVTPGSMPQFCPKEAHEAGCCPSVVITLRREVAQVPRGSRVTGWPTQRLPALGLHHAERDGYIDVAAGFSRQKPVRVDLETNLNFAGGGAQA
jgi:hypothetical protein